MTFSKNPGCSRRRDRCQGFTLADILTTLAVVSVALTVAAPAMQDFVIRNRMSTEVNTFVTSLYLARSEAVKRIRTVSLCPTNDFTSCTDSTEWNIGWMVYANNDGAPGYNAGGGDVILQRVTSLPSRFSVTGSRNAISYNTIGQAEGGNYAFCDTGNVADGRKVEVSNDGRVYVVAITGADCAPVQDGGGDGDGGGGGGGGGAGAGY